MPQIDLRFTNPEEGGLVVVVAPVMRFKDIAFNANVKIEDSAPPDRIISVFALEIFLSPLQLCRHLLECLQSAEAHLDLVKHYSKVGHRDYDNCGLDTA